MDDLCQSERVWTMSGFTILKGAFEGLKKNRGAYAGDGAVSRYANRGALAEEGADTPTDYKLDTTFAFIPVFEQDGGVTFYIRLGGPEFITKMDTNPTNRTLSRTLESFGINFRKEFRSTYSDGMFGGHVDSNFAYENAYERHFLQQIEEVNDRELYALRAEFYPLRLRKVGKHFDLDYAGKDGWKNLNRTETASDFTVSMLNDLMRYMGDDDLKEVLAWLSPSSQGKMGKLVNNLFIKTIMADFKATVRYHAFSLYDEVDTFGGSNDLDQIFVAGLIQLVPRQYQGGNFTAQQLMGLLESNVYTDRYAYSDADLTTIATSVAGYYNAHSVAAEAQDQGLVVANKELKRQLNVSKEAVAEAKLASDQLLHQLQAKLKTAQEEEKNVLTHRVIGMGMGLGSAYYATYHGAGKDLEMPVKVGIMAVGALLGAVPFLNYATIAATPFVVDYAFTRELT